MSMPRTGSLQKCALAFAGAEHYVIDPLTLTPAADLMDLRLNSLLGSFAASSDIFSPRAQFGLKGTEYTPINDSDLP